MDFKELRAEYLGLSDTQGRQQFLSDPNCSPELLAEIAWASGRPEWFSGEWEEWKIARAHPNLSPKVIESYLLSKHEDQFCNYLFLFNPNFPIPLLAQMEGEDEPFTATMLRQAISQHECIPEILEIASDHPSAHVRIFLAANPALPHHLIQKLLFDADYTVQLALLRNQSIPSEEFIVILTPQAGAEPRKIKAEVLQKLIEKLPEGIHRNQAVKILTNSSKSAPSRRLVARYTTNLGKVEEGCLDRNLKVRQAAIRNPIASEEGLVSAALLGTPENLKQK